MFDTNKDGKVSLSEYLGKYEFTQLTNSLLFLPLHSFHFE